MISYIDDSTATYDLNILQSRSLLHTYHSILYAGNITCYVQVYDNYGIYTTSTYDGIILVTEEKDQKILEQTILNNLQLNTNSGNINNIQK